MSEVALQPTLAIERLAAGEVLADRYELRARLGQGGMGEVWRAHDRELDEDVALKVLGAEHAATEEAHLRFRREVKLARRVTHPNVARTYDLGRHGAIRFFTMELIQGESLGSRMRTLVPLVESLRLAAEVCRGLAAAHAQGVVHRDLKPDNVMLSGERVVITDFGIARAEGDARMTSGSIVGTPAYMAPEQLDARAIDGRADVYALGVVLFELVTQSLPFHGDTPFAMAAARLTGPPPDPRTRVPTVPDGVAALIREMLALRREDRPDAQTAVARIDALRGVGGPVRPLTPPSLISLTLGERASDGRDVRVDDLEAGSDAKTLAGDVTRALRDALATERGARVVSSGGDLVASGEIRVANGRARARVRLANKSGNTVWASRVEGDATDPFALEDAVVAEVASAIRARVGGRYGPPEGPLRERWERARGLLGTMDPKSTREGMTLLEEVLRDAPGEASAQSLLALASVHLWLQTGAVDDSLSARAEELALRALDGDPSLADAYLAVATVRSVFGDNRAAVSALREALNRAPTYPDAHLMLARLFFETGHVAEGLQRYEVAQRFGPLRATAISYLVRAHALAGDEARARAEIDKHRGTAVGRSLLPLFTELAVWWNDKAMAIEAADGIEAARSGASWDVAVPLLRAFASGADVTEIARRTFAPARGRRASAWNRAKIGMIAAVYFAYAGLTDEALREIEVVAEQPPFLDLLWLDRVPQLAPFRGEPRFAAARAVVAARVAEVGL